MTPHDVFTPEMLAARWRCSPAHVRHLARRGLRCFRLGGKLMRFKRADVEEYERCQGMGDSGTESSKGESSSHGSTPQGSGIAVDLEPLTRARLETLHRRFTPS